MFWSCAETYELRDVLEEAKNAPKQIVFGNGFFKKTKGVIENNTDLQGITLGVYARINANNGVNGPTTTGISYADGNQGFLINNDALSWSGSVWACANTYFWPKRLHNVNTDDPTVNFYAYGPKDIGTVTNTNGVISIAISATGTNNNAKDLVYDSELNQTYDFNGAEEKVNDKGYVNFNMTHQMSWVSFEAKKTTDFTTLTISSIAVNVDESTGTFKINTTDAVADGLEAHTAALTNANPTVSYTYSFTPNTTVTSSYARVADFIALPQTLSNNTTATITYTAVIGGVTYADRVAVLQLNGGNLTEACCATAPWEVTNWEANYKYTYHINFEWEEIKFTASVTEWSSTNHYYRIY